MDFYKIIERPYKKGHLEVKPNFDVDKTKDLMIRGSSFYAIWNEEKGLWSTDEYDVPKLVDKDLQKYLNDLESRTDDVIDVKWMKSFDSNTWLTYKKFIKSAPDNYVQLDTKITFADTPVKRSDHVSMRLPYSMKKGKISAYEELMSTLYEKEERRKIEWAIGSIIEGDSKRIQKFLVFYGDPGTGKSTVLDIIGKLFQGYCGTFDSKELASKSNLFSAESFRANPLIAIQDDGDLSEISDNSKLNSIVSHAIIEMHEKFKSAYPMRINSFLFMGTNKPVKITDAKAGLIRRLIDVHPTGNKIPEDRYFELIEQIDYELGAIAYHCHQVYLKFGKSYYSKYRPVDMMYKTDTFFNFVEACEDVFEEQDGTTLTQAFAMYKQYCEEGGYDRKLVLHSFREELKNYFKSYEERTRVDGRQVRNYYSGFKFDKFNKEVEYVEKTSGVNWIKLNAQPSLFDLEMKDCIAQYSNEKGVPYKKWANVDTKLKDLDTSKLHYVKVPENLIVIDFDISDNGEKSLEKNLEAASKFPQTYVETSKSGKGLHLHYIWDGDPMLLSSVYDEHIEIKVFVGNSSLRRMLTLCNDIPIATLSSGLPLRKEKKMISQDVVKSERHLRKLIEKNLRKEIHPATKPSIDFIYKILEDAYNDGLHYDVTNMFQDIYIFAMNSTNNSDYCLDLVDKMHFKSKDVSEPVKKETPIIFFDVEVFPNLFLVNWKLPGEDQPVHRMINPTSEEIEELLYYRWIGFNNRRYDNHIMYARLMGYSNEQLYHLSQRIIVLKDKDAMFQEAYNWSYTDVYDFASAGNKMGLKKLEILMKMHHKELNFKWDEPVPKDKWEYVAEYCDNDVIATEAAFNYLKGDWLSRLILADLAEMTPNDTTNSLTTKLIFGNNKKPQSSFNYRFMGDESQIDEIMTKRMIKESGLDLDLEFTKFDKFGRPIFPGYSFEAGVSMYRGEEVGEGGYVYAEPGMYGNVGLDDVESMHPSSIEDEELFGPEYTKKFVELKAARLAIKHEDWDTVHKLMDGKLDKYVEKVKSGEITSKQLANALKTAINSVYGLTSAAFNNPFRDVRNKDNIVAKRGALFMINLKHEVQKRGYTVAHIKTDSIKIPDVDNDIIEFIKKYGNLYGYNFDYEAIYDKMCLVNDAVYIAKYATKDKCAREWGFIPGDNKKSGGEWTATGKQFQIPFIFKTLFSKEELEFDDFCLTKSVSSALYLDMNEALKDDEHNYQFVGKVGSFCPIKPRRGGGLLLRESGEDKFAAAEGTKGYRFLEAEDVLKLNKEDDIDKSYFVEMANKAIDSINEYGDYEWFVSEDEYESAPFIGAKIVA